MRTADRARFIQSFCVGGSALAQSKRCGGAAGSCAGFSSLRCAQSDPGGQWRALWWQRRTGVVALERVVAASGHRGAVCAAGSPRRQRRARTNAPGLESRCGYSTCAQRGGTEKTHYFLDRLLQLPASSRSLGPARPRADLLAEQSAFAGAITTTELSMRVGHKAGAQPWPHQMARPGAFCRTSLCWPMDRAERGQPMASTKFISIVISLACSTSKIWPECDRPPSLVILEADRPPSPSVKAGGLRARA